MEKIDSLSKLSYRSNIETYRYNDKYIILYDDHRYILNVLFEAFKMGVLKTSPNLIYFDRHDDACNPNITKNELFKKWVVDNIKDVGSQDFWSFVEFGLGTLDDDWLLAGMELGLINHSVLIGQCENDNIEELNGKFKSTEGHIHELHSIKHLNQCLDSKGCLGDVVKVEENRKVRDIFEYNLPPYSERRFADNITTPLVLDFDLDCFSLEVSEVHCAWPETIFRKIFYDNEVVYFFMQDLIYRSQFITICREPKYCGGLGESNKILGYLDKYFFNGALDTMPIE